MKKSEFPKVAIVTLNYNGLHLLDKHYTSLLNQSYTNATFILVDNGSSDGSEAYIKKNFPKVSVIKLKENVGPVGGYKAGAKAVPNDCKYMIICGNDTWFDQDWIKEQVNVMEQDESIALCAGRQMNYKGTAEINFGLTLDLFGYALAGKELFYMDGVALMMHKKIYEKVGGYDEQFWVYGEEADLAWRVRLFGYKIAKAPKAIFYHLGGATLDGKGIKADKAKMYQTTYMKRYLTEKNTLNMLLKNYSALALVLILPLFLIINFLEGIALTVLGKPALLKSHINAWGWNLKNINQTLKKRKFIQSNREVSDYDIIKHMYKGWAKFLALRKLGIPAIK